MGEQDAEALGILRSISELSIQNGLLHRDLGDDDRALAAFQEGLDALDRARELLGPEGWRRDVELRDRRVELLGHRALRRLGLEGVEGALADLEAAAAEGEALRGEADPEEWALVTEHGLQLVRAHALRGLILAGEGEWEGALGARLRAGALRRIEIAARLESGETRGLWRARCDLLDHLLAMASLLGELGREEEERARAEEAVSVGEGLLAAPREQWEGNATDLVDRLVRAHWLLALSPADGSALPSPAARAAMDRALEFQEVLFQHLDPGEWEGAGEQVEAGIVRLVQRALVRHETGDPRGAREDLDRAVELGETLRSRMAPEEWNAELSTRRALAMAHFQRGSLQPERGIPSPTAAADLARAREGFEGILAVLSPGDRQANLHLLADLSQVRKAQGEEAARGEDGAGALDHFDAALALAREGAEDPDAGDARTRLASLHRARGEVLRSRGALVEALEAFQAGEEALGSPGSEATEALRQEGSLLADRLGAVFLELGDHPRALAALDRAAALGEELAREGRQKGTGSHLPLLRELSAAHSNRGNACRDLGHAAEAVAAYDRALELIREVLAWPGVAGEGGYGDPDLEESLATTLGNRGNARADQGDVEGALEDYGEAIARLQALRKRLGPERWWDGRKAPRVLAAAHRNRAMTLDGLERFTEALEDVDAAAALHDEIRLRKGPAWWLHPDEVAGLAGVLLSRGHLLLELGAPVEAVEAYDASIALAEELRGHMGDDAWWAAPRHVTQLADAWNNRGNTLETVGRVDEALRSYDRALELGSGLADRMEAEAWRAAPELRRALALHHRNRGEVRHTLGEVAGALDDLSRAVELAEGVREALGEEAWWENPELPLALALHRVSLADALETAGRPEEIEVPLQEAGAELSRLRRHRHAAPLRSRIDRTLARVHGGLALARFARGAFAAAEDTLWTGVQEVPHEVILLRSGGLLYQLLLGVDPRTLEAGGLPREEVLEGYVEFLTRVAPLHQGSWEGVVARARYHADALGDPEEGARLLSEASARWGESEPRLPAAWLHFAAEHGRWEEGWRVGVELARTLGGRIRTEMEAPEERRRGWAELLLDAVDTLSEILGTQALRDEERLDRAWSLRELLQGEGMAPLLTRASEEWKDTLLERLARVRAEGKAALQREREESRRRIQSREWMLAAGLGDRALEVLRELDRLDGAHGRGEMDEEEWLEARGEALLWLRDSQEARESRGEAVRELEERLGVEVAGTPVFQGILMALETRGLPGPWWGSWGTAGVATTVEALFREELLAGWSPEGEAGSAPSRAAPPRKVDLRTVALVVGKLAKHWDSDPLVAGLARWVETRFHDAPRFRARLREDRWPTALEWLKEHRNPAAHGLEAHPPEVAEEALVLALERPGLLPGLLGHARGV